ncbi:MAG TPA: TetR/AcrR family transcriptional regulator [Candidatus Acidoferrum sp.]|nr:TetR/AcrR family transcriptional regulator [Candidatus Acidoferrum sp.]
MSPDSASKASRNGRHRRRYLARRLEILRAAGRQFRARGFVETGMRDIAEAAELSPANLYNYFQGKHEILFFCQDSSLDRMIAALDKARRIKGSASAKLRFVIVSHLRCLLDEIEGSAAHLLTNALPPRQQRYLVTKRDRYELGVRNLIASGMRMGELVSGDAALMARAILGALNWSVQWFRPDGEMTADEIAEILADYLVRGLLARAESIGQPASQREARRLARKNVREAMRNRVAVG